jgi:hypothetical protein
MMALIRHAFGVPPSPGGRLNEQGGPSRQIPHIRVYVKNKNFQKNH